MLQYAPVMLAGPILCVNLKSPPPFLLKKKFVVKVFSERKSLSKKCTGSVGISSLGLTISSGPPSNTTAFLTIFTVYIPYYFYRINSN